MNGYTLTESAQRTLRGARDEAARLGSEAVGAEHIVLSLLRHEPSARATLAALGLDTAVVQERLEAGSRKGGKSRGNAAPGPGAPNAAAPAGDEEPQELPYTSHAKRLIELGSKEARERDASLAADHLLVAALHEPRGTVAKILNDAGISPAQAYAEALRAVDGTAAIPPAPPTVPAPAAAAPEPRDGGRRAKGEGKSPQRERAPRAERVERAERAERPERQERGTRSDRGERAVERPERTAARPERTPERAPERPEDRPARRLPPHLERAARGSSWGPVWQRLLLLAVPAGIVLDRMHAPPAVVFFVACLSVLPLAGYMGTATEHLALRTGPTIGGLLNATFGNAAELIIAIVALRSGLVSLVKASITGSILGNLLLILGLSLVVGGVNRQHLRFNRTAAGMSATMLALAVVGLVFPALFHATHPAPERLTELQLSEGVAVVLAATYLLSLLFSLKTHRNIFGGDPHPVDGPAWGVGRAVLVLAAATAGIAFMSEILVHATEGATASLGLTETFLGLVIIPIIGNAAEHATAVMMARKGQMDLALQIALGSSTQIALLVAPLLVFIGVAMGRNMNLVFSPFEVMAVGLATIVTAISTADGESHWFEGVQLLAVYALVGVAAYFL